MMHWSLGWYDSPFDNGQERSGLEHLESHTGVWVGKTPLLIKGKEEVVCNICNKALEFEWVRLFSC